MDSCLLPNVSVTNINYIVVQRNSLRANCFEISGCHRHADVLIDRFAEYFLNTQLILGIHHQSVIIPNPSGDCNLEVLMKLLRFKSTSLTNKMKTFLRCPLFSTNHNMSTVLRVTKRNGASIMPLCTLPTLYFNTLNMNSS